MPSYKIWENATIQISPMDLFQISPFFRDETSLLMKPPRKPRSKKAKATNVPPPPPGGVPVLPVPRQTPMPTAAP